MTLIKLNSNSKVNSFSLNNQTINKNDFTDVKITDKKLKEVMRKRNDIVVGIKTEKPKKVVEEVKPKKVVEEVKPKKTTKKKTTKKKVVSKKKKE